jgi:hypothetical protein
LATTVEAALALSGAVVAAPIRCPHSELPPFDAHGMNFTKFYYKIIDVFMYQISVI